jgi:hypothetical protein
LVTLAAWERLFWDMNIRKRSTIMGIVLVIVLILYGTAKMYSYILVEYVVEKTLIQKAPAGTDAAEVHRLLEELLASIPDKSAKTNLLFGISGELEKVQVLSPRALQELLEPQNAEILK